MSWLLAPPCPPPILFFFFFFFSPPRGILGRHIQYMGSLCRMYFMDTLLIFGTYSQGYPTSSQLPSSSSGFHFHQTDYFQRALCAGARSQSARHRASSH